MRVTATTDAPPATDADTIVVGVFEDEGIAHDHGGVLQALVDSGEAKRGLRKLAVTHAEGRRYIVAGLGGRVGLRPRAGAGGRGDASSARAKELGTQDAVLGGPAPRHRRARRRAGRGHAARRLHVHASTRATPTTPGLEALILSAHHDVSAPRRAAATVVAEAVNAARDLQNRAGQRPHAGRRWPSARGRSRACSVDVLDRAGDRGRRDGRVRRASRAARDEEPRLITIRYEPADVAGPLLGFVGKAVTFDSGGISIKPAAKMHEMKFDMSRRRRGAGGRRRDRARWSCRCASRA